LEQLIKRPYASDQKARKKEKAIKQMAELQPQFWFTQISSGLQSQAVVKAVNQVVELFTGESKLFRDEFKNTGILSSSSLKAEDVRKFLELNAEPPFYVLGTVTKNEAVVQSWKDLGLNFFDLPWCKEKKIFHYIPILSLPDMLKAVICSLYEDNDAYEVQNVHAINDIKWANCHKWIREIQRCFGHGNRDRMQFYGAVDAKKETPKIPETLPCSECHVHKVLKNAYKNMSPEDGFQQLLRKIANLDCQSYRLAPLSSIPLNVKSQYKRVIILEDDKDMREHIEKRIKEYYGDVIIQKASVEESRKKWRLCTDNGTEIEFKDKEKKYNGWETLVCFDLELGEAKETDSLPDGLRILYNTALHHPFVSRLVITGYRTQDERSLNAGTCGFLLKPFSNKELHTAIETSSPFSALWICPKTVRENWENWGSKVYDEADYNWIKNRLAIWLGQYHIGLDDISKYDELRITEYSVIIMDYYSIDPNHDLNGNQADAENTIDKLVNDYLKIRSSNPNANIIIILPMEDHIFKPFGVLHSVGHIIRDGHDTILHKPMWICSDDPQVESLGQTIKTTLEERPLFDVKYVIYTPIMGLVWPKALKFFEQQAMSSDKRPDKALDPVDGWSPLGVLMGVIWGFTASFKDILDDPRLGLELQ
jgi:DNA-binding NarL/FixJ family response regulator